METHIKAITGPSLFQIAPVGHSWPHFVQVCPSFTLFGLMSLVWRTWTQFGTVWTRLAPFKKGFFCIGIVPHTTLGSIFSVNPFS